MQWVMGHGSPTLSGMGLPGGRAADTAASARNGVHFKTSVVHADICAVKSGADGKSTKFSAPLYMSPV